MDYRFPGIAGKNAAGYRAALKNQATGAHGSLSGVCTAGRKLVFLPCFPS